MLRSALAHLRWRGQDYAYVLRRQADALPRPRRRGVVADPTPEERAGERGPRPDVILVPGVYESWRFMAPLASLLSRHGHRVHVLRSLGYNRRPVPAGAALLGRYLAEHDLRDVVVVGHSKGGLIGKLAMVREDPAGRIRSLVAISTPFAGSDYARWVPLPAVRAFVPTDATLALLDAEPEVNARITSVYSRFDPHIPAGSALDGARNVELATPGHFRVLADPQLGAVLLDAVSARASSGVGRPRRPPLGAPRTPAVG